ncbi:MAG: FAD-dependent oxidoreductase [Traorella sp.]
MNLKYPKLFEPLKVNHVVLKNRIISAPLGSNTDKSLSGIGMIIRGTSGSVDDSRMRLAPGPYCFEDLFKAAKVREEVSIIKQAGAKAEFELCHCGQFAMVKPGDYAIGPVSFIREDGTEVKAMDEEMMEDIANKYAKTAKVVKEYGFDSILLHFAHGWLPAEFLSPYFNTRTDEYGGCIENRIKFPTMIVDKVREAVGPDFMLDMRISGDEHIEGGLKIDDVIYFIKSLGNKIDMVHLSCGVEVNTETKTYMSSTSYLPHKINVEMAKKLKANVDIPVAVVGAIMTPEEAEEILEEGCADAVVIGRQLIADPWWVKKAWEGRSEDITPCIRCMNCYNPYQYRTPEELKSHVGMNAVPCCSVNPRHLHEDRVPNVLEKASVKKKVVIVGGGPAGMKAALTAWQRGHEVDLYEMDQVLGGQLTCADYDESKQDIKRYKDYLIKQIRKSDVHVHLNTKVEPDDIKAMKPDSLILALGAYPNMIQIDGIETVCHMNAIEAFKNMSKIGNDVLIIGGGSIGCELGVDLAKQGKTVTIAEIGATLNRTLNDIMKTSLRMQMEKYTNLKAYVNTKTLRIDNHKAILNKENEIISIHVDTVIIAAGMISRIDEANEFYGIVQDTNIIGDAQRVGTIWNAQEDGYYICAHM